MTDPVSLLIEDRPHRVWSVLVTVFGDLALDDGARLSGADLRAIGSQIGYRPEALRVALHRLRKDGWIESHRRGRTTEYALTDWGRAQSRAARPRIYATASPRDLWMVLPAPGAAMDDAVHWVTPQIGLSCRAGDIRVVDPLPDWMRDQVCAPELLAQAEDASSRLGALNRALETVSGLTDVQVATLRVLVVHTWRRIVLKTPHLPDRAFPDAWRGAECRTAVADALSCLPAPHLARVETAHA